LSPLHILALDTTTRGGSVAVNRDGTLIVARTGDPALTHGERLPHDIMAALEAAHLQVGDVDLLAVGAGPGSFTGLRVGIATVQGLAVARGIKVVPVSTLEALVRSLDGSAPNHLLAAWMDGQRGEVFAALYGDAQRELLPAMAGSPETVLHSWRRVLDRPVVFVGDGAVRYRAVIDTGLGPSARIVAPAALAGTIARMAFEEPQRAVAPHEIVPIYVRRPDAELARERRQALPGDSAAPPVKNRELG
jgi:tRNA threonylcarbamoyladenosine biosynthesis protein TsaB